jgi:heme-degrading monooxygenase HmoA
LTPITISENDGYVTFINVFRVDSKDQQKLIDLLTRATDGGVSKAPGFISGSLHRSTDGTKVTVYAQWRSMDDFLAMGNDPGRRVFLEQVLKEVLEISTFEPQQCEVVRTFRAPL